MPGGRFATAAMVTSGTSGVVLDVDGAVRLVPADAVLGASTVQALASANAWLGRARDAAPTTEQG